MFKTIIPSMRFILLFNIFFILLFVCPTYGDASGQFQLAESYYWSDELDQAEVLYKQIVADYPETEEALLSQKVLVILYIKTNEDDQVDACACCNCN